jgi:hypothetical protein
MPIDVPTVAMLLSEAALWTRYVARNDGYASLVHAALPAQSDVVVVSDGAVLSGLNGGYLKISDALARSLIIVDTPGPEGDAVVALLLATSDVAVMSAAKGPEYRMRWGLVRGNRGDTPR